MFIKRWLTVFFLLLVAVPSNSQFASFMASTTNVWSTVDGSPGASNGTIQRPTILNGFATRPPWQVAGVDYAVGPHTGITYKIPGVDTLPAGFIYDPGNRRVHTFGASPGITLDGWDFTTTGFYIDIQSDSGTIKNCKVGIINGANFTGMGNWVFEYNIIDGFSTPTDPNLGYQTFVAAATAGTTVTFRYNYFLNAYGDIAQIGATPNIVIRWNLFENWAQGDAGVHGDLYQGRGGVINSFVNDFNTYYVLNWGALGSGGSQGISVPGSANVITDPVTLNGGSVSYNTVVPLVDLGQFYIISAGDINGTVLFQNNYILRTHFTENPGTFGVFVISGTAGAGGHHNFTGSVTGGGTIGNIDLATGTPFLSGTLYTNFLLKRDIDPAANDNDPMWMEKAA